MKILSKPDISTWKCEVTCWQCTSKMEVDGDDLHHKREKKYSSDDSWGGGSYMEDVFYILCGVCGGTVEVNATTTKMPFLLRQKVMKGSK